MAAFAEPAGSAFALQKDTWLQHEQAIKWFFHQAAEITSVKGKKNVSPRERAE